MALWIFLLNLAASLYMTGLIWFVQVVHYPLFGAVGASGYGTYQQRHMSLTTWVVGPPMLLEALTAAALLWLRPAFVDERSCWLLLGLLAAVWLSTALLQVPQHEKLSAGFDADAHRWLVAGNWVRTAAWSLRSTLLLWLLSRGLTATAR